MPQQFIILIVAAAALLLVGGVCFFCGRGSLDSRKAKPVVDGQHGTARWATPKEISQTFSRIPFRPTQWRKGMNLPKAQGLVLGSQGKKGKIIALVDSDDIHCLMSRCLQCGSQAHKASHVHRVLYRHGPRYDDFTRGQALRADIPRPARHSDVRPPGRPWRTP